MKRLLYVLAGVAVLACLTGCEKDEAKKASIQGQVIDIETGQILSGLTVRLEELDKETTTAEDGTFQFKHLRKGNYTIKIQQEGYVDYVKKDIELAAGQSMRVDIAMAKGYMETELDLGMVYVEGGFFEMGATPEQGEDAYENEKPVRNIRLDSYYIGKYEITQAQWTAVMGTSLEEQMILADEFNYGILGSGSEYPMYYISWEDAKQFCDKLSEATGKKYMLPTEAQWEYAARGGNKSRHFRYSGSDDVDEVAWYENNSGIQSHLVESHPVGLKEANELGIYDMSGNVWEWCSDWYDASYDEKETENPQGPDKSIYPTANHVTRGGCYMYNAENCRAAFRFSEYPDLRNYYIGFRVVMMP